VLPGRDTAADEIDALKAALAAERAGRAAAEAEAARAIAAMSSAEALIAHLRLAIEKMKRELYGSRAERGHKLLDQMELELEELETTASEEATAAVMAAATGSTGIAAHTQRKPVRKSFPEHLPRERVIVPGPTACTCCGSTKLSKLGEDVTETLEVVPRRWKVIQHVREKFACRACEKISQAPAPFHVIARGRGGSAGRGLSLLARPQRRAPRAPPGVLPRHSAG
jgi:transposase